MVVLQELEGFTYATALDLNMGYYTIRLDPDASRICTIIFPWGKYSYCLGGARWKVTLKVLWYPVQYQRSSMRSQMEQAMKDKLEGLDDKDFEIR